MSYQHLLDLCNRRISRFCLALILPVAILTTISVSPVWSQAVAEAPSQLETSEAQTDPEDSADIDSSEPDPTEPDTETTSVDIQELLFNGMAPTTLNELRAMEAHFAKLAEKVKPAVVNISMAGSQGSGVVISSDGYVLTAAHVIGNPNGSAMLTFPDGKKVTAKTLGIHRQVDSGMLKIQPAEGDDDEFDYPYLDLGLSSDLNKGQWVMAIGHPGGLDEARGLVVRIGRLISQKGTVLTTDCTLVGGDSGGPLFDMNGDVIGINSRIGRDLWHNLHVPADQFSENWDDLDKGIVLDGRPNLGFRIVESTNEIEVVKKGQPAEKAGLKAGDFIVKIGRKNIEDSEDIDVAVERLRPNMKIKIVVKRDDEEKKIEFVVGER